MRPSFVLLALFVASALHAVPASQAQPAPAVDFANLLDTRFFPQQGEFLYATPKAFLIFPPAGLDPYDVDGAYLVRDAEG